jgi:hypothetical protein
MEMGSMSDATYEYGRKVEQAGPRARAVMRSLGLQTGDLTVLNNALTPGDSEESQARLARAGLIERDATGQRSRTAAGGAALNLGGAANRLDTAEDMVDPAVDPQARQKIQEEKKNLDEKWAAIEATRRGR